MDEAAIRAHLAANFAGLQVTATDGATAFAYNPDGAGSAGVYFATLKSKDDANDDVSELDRPSVFRLNLGVTEATYQRLFGPPPPRPGEDGLIETTHDFAVLDRLMPHPVYAYMAWVCVLNPSGATFETVKPLLAEAYALAQSRYVKRPAEG